MYAITTYKTLTRLRIFLRAGAEPFLPCTTRTFRDYHCACLWTVKTRTFDWYSAVEECGIHGGHLAVMEPEEAFTKVVNPLLQATYDS